MKDEEESDDIRVPKSVVQLGAVAILFVIIDMTEGLIDLITTSDLNIGRIIMRSLGILGWLAVEYLAINALWSNRKKKHNG